MVRLQTFFFCMVHGFTKFVVSALALLCKNRKRPQIQSWCCKGQKKVGQDLQRLERKKEAKETVPQGIQGKPKAEPRSRMFADSIGAGKARVEGLFQWAEILGHEKVLKDV